MSAWYNEIDPQKAAWLRELIARGVIAPGDVDERSIDDVRADDLARYTQCHFFAGIGIWSYALRLAGWPDDRPVWTGSCPCQPFSAAGKQEGFEDPRHLWPEWFRLIRECCPNVLYFEQVAAALGWFDLVSRELEREGYAVGAAVMGAHSVGAPHIRQRIYGVAESEHAERRPDLSGNGCDGANAGWAQAHGEPRTCGEVCSMGDDSRHGRNEGRTEPEGKQGRPDVTESGGAVGLGDMFSPRLQERASDGRVQRETMEPPAGEALERSGYTGGFWADADWLWCRDEKYRPVEPGTFPLAHGSPARVGRSGDSGFPLAQKAEARVARLRGYGDGIVAPAAEAFIRAFMETTNGI